MHWYDHPNFAKSQRLAQRYPDICHITTTSFMSVENITISFDKKRFPA
jgi:hypothetical protein